MTKKKSKEAILLFSGGKDSFLAACLLVERGYKINIVNFKTVASKRGRKRGRTTFKRGISHF